MGLKGKKPSFLLIGFFGILPLMAYMVGVNQGYGIREQEEEKEVSVVREITTYSDCKNKTLSGIVTSEYTGVGHSFIANTDFQFRAYEISQDDKPACYGIVYKGDDELFIVGEEVTLTLGNVQRMIPPENKYLDGKLLKQLHSYEIVEYSIEGNSLLQEDGDDNSTTYDLEDLNERYGLSDEE